MRIYVYPHIFILLTHLLTVKQQVSQQADQQADQQAISYLHAKKEPLQALFLLLFTAKKQI